jgi:hypothetical protein
MREEKVTINLLNWLESQGWSIICYDFPQSGTGLMFHPNPNVNQNEKNKGGIIPDIIAIRGSIAVYFENKDRFVKSDFDKLKEIKLFKNYSDGLNELLNKYGIAKIYYGIGIPSITKEIDKSKEHLEDVDFLVSTDSDGNVMIHHDINAIFTPAS